MKIDRIAYEQLYPTGVYANQRYRVEASIQEEGGDIIKCFAELKKTVEDAFVEMNPQIQWSQPMFHPPTEESSQKENSVQPKDERIQSFIEMVNSKYQTKKTLENLRAKIEAENNPELTAAFESKLKSFE